MPQVDNPSLKGKVALVTGASRGIGRAVAERLASAGASVAVTARSLDSAAREPGTLTETVERIEANGGRAVALGADLESAEDRQALVGRTVEALGGLDILVNSAGYAQYVTIAEMPDEIFDRTIDHYLRAPFVLCRAAIPVMKERGAGWIVNIGSVTSLPPMRPYGEFDRHLGPTLYAATKAALSRFTQGLAAELEEFDIAVNQVGPTSAILTPGAARYIPDGFPTEDVAYLAECALQLSYLSAKERTGLVTHSMHFPNALNFEVRSVDGKTVLPPPVEPEYSHPGIDPSGN
jgi:NAD(P)-dependent dehydrogenase (short-subunit alcohol dehydrogenase family)